MPARDPFYQPKMRVRKLVDLPAEPAPSIALSSSADAISRAETIMRVYGQQKRWNEAQPTPMVGSTWQWTDISAPPAPSEFGKVEAHWRPLKKADRELFALIQWHTNSGERLPSIVVKAIAAALNVTDDVERRNRALRAAQIEGRNRAKRSLGIAAPEPKAAWLARQPGVGVTEAIIREWRRAKSYQKRRTAAEAHWLSVYRNNPDYDLGHASSDEHDRMNELREAMPFDTDEVNATKAAQWVVQQIRSHEGMFPPPDARLVAYDLAVAQTRNGQPLSRSARIAIAAALGLLAE